MKIETDDDDFFHRPAQYSLQKKDHCLLATETSPVKFKSNKQRQQKKGNDVEWVVDGGKTKI